MRKNKRHIFCFCFQTFLNNSEQERTFYSFSLCHTAEFTVLQESVILDANVNRID